MLDGRQIGFAESSLVRATTGPVMVAAPVVARTRHSRRHANDSQAERSESRHSYLVSTLWPGALGVDLMSHNTNHSVLVAGPELVIKPLRPRRNTTTVGGAR